MSAPESTSAPGPGPSVTEDPGWDGDRGFRPIESYGVVGDLETVALVGDDGSIDWFCPQRFDAPSIFAGLLDPGRAGSFRIAPVGRAARAPDRPEGCGSRSKDASSGGPIWRSPSPGAVCNATAVWRPPIACAATSAPRSRSSSSCGSDAPKWCTPPGTI
mgnify:CR=1 FL=1